MTENIAPYIALSGVTKAYRIGGEMISIFSRLDLAIPQGDFVAVMGPSGSGKSTLLNMLAGIDSPDSGTLRIGTSRLDQMGEAARAAWRAHNMGIVFQFYNLLPMLSVAENVELPLLLKPLSRKERRSRVDKVLDLVGLAGRAKQYPALMSGGQQQRIGIARAIVSDPGLLLCDEPTGGPRPQIRRRGSGDAAFPQPAPAKDHRHGDPRPAGRPVCPPHSASRQG